MSIKKLPQVTTTLRWLLRRGSPLPIPNREVKPACADGTAICGRVCRRLSLEPQLFKLGFFFLMERRVRPSGSDRRLCFACSVKASGLWNPSFLSWGSFFYWNDVFGYRLGSLKTLFLTKQGFLFLERRVRPSGSVRRLCFARSANASGL